MNEGRWNKAYRLIALTWIARFLTMSMVYAQEKHIGIKIAR